MCARACVCVSLLKEAFPSDSNFEGPSEATFDETALMLKCDTKRKKEKMHQDETEKQKEGKKREERNE